MSEKKTQFILSVLEGSQKGETFELSTDQISIGRESDNGIVLDDPRTSRHHALITIEEDIVKIRDLDSQNGVFINGQKIKKAKIKIGNKVHIGNTILELNEKPVVENELSHILQADTPSVSHLPPVDNKTNLTLTPHTALTKLNQKSKSDFELKPSALNLQAQLNIPPPTSTSGIPPVSKTKRAQKSNNLLAPIILALLVIGYLLLQTNKDSSKNKSYGIRTDDEVQREISSIESRTNELIRVKTTEGHFNRQHEEAHASYIQGFRDYREGHYQRAIQYFTAALALNPGHVLAQKYKKQSELKLDELVQTSLREGKRHFEQNRFELAKSSFKRILVLLNDPNNKIYQEAYQRVQEIELILKGKY